jgi:hypothetical protein
VAEEALHRRRTGRENPRDFAQGNALTHRPTALDIDEARRHPGFLAEAGGFATVVFPRGEDRSDPLFAIYADEGGGPAKRLWLGNVFWLNWLESLASTACKAHRDGGGSFIASGYGKRAAA